MCALDRELGKEIKTIVIEPIAVPVPEDPPAPDTQTAPVAPEEDPEHR
jgi:hypothetical protein